MITFLIIFQIKLLDFIKKYPYRYLTSYNFGSGHKEFCSLLKKAYDDIDSLSFFEKYPA